MKEDIEMIVVDTRLHDVWYAEVQDGKNMQTWRTLSVITFIAT